MSDTKMGFGIVGCGLVSQFHGAAIMNSQKAELIAATDPNAERLEEFIAKYGGEKAESFEALLADERIEVVNILTPNAMHADFAIPALRAGKHVIVEKPPEMKLSKTDDMIAAAEENNRKLAISLQVRFRESIRAIKGAIEQGRFGKLLEGDAYMKWFRPSDYYHMDDWRSKREQGAGVTIQHAFHYIDLLHHLMGPVKVVDARMTNLMHPDVALEDTLKAFLYFENGAEGLVEASTALWPGRPPRIEVNGADGTAVTEGEIVLAWDFRDERPEDEHVRQIGRGSVAAGGTGAADLSYEEHMWLVDDMVDAIAEDRDPYITAKNARHSLEIALAMYLSADAGEPVELPLPADVSI
ncbi:MAG: Gfo/Idh/MocA family oxidoreductase [candidate division WS1 bacterium]|jgi:predicted dehydrogenase|nr:Gfo/Idh/MocA family oxidoreductase [candidate division WS1 bacterium]